MKTCSLQRKEIWNRFCWEGNLEPRAALWWRKTKLELRTGRGKEVGFWEKGDGAFGAQLQLCSLCSAEAGKANDYGSLMKNTGYSTNLKNQVQKSTKPVFGDLLTTIKRERSTAFNIMCYTCINNLCESQSETIFQSFWLCSFLALNSWKISCPYFTGHILHPTHQSSNTYKQKTRQNTFSLKMHTLPFPASQLFL